MTRSCLRQAGFSHVDTVLSLSQSNLTQFVAQRLSHHVYKEIIQMEGKVEGCLEKNLKPLGLVSVKRYYYVCGTVLQDIRCQIGLKHLRLTLYSEPLGQHSCLGGL